jgi:hypothetical protein
MIASIDRQFNIDVYLDPKELSRLESEVLSGVIIKNQKPKQQAEFYVSVNDKGSNENGCGIGVKSEGYSWEGIGVIEIFLSTEAFRTIKENGRVGYRHSIRDGAKIHFYDRSRHNGYSAERFEHYRDNKDRLPADFA